MQKELQDLQPSLIESQKNTEEIMKQIEARVPEVDLFFFKSWFL